MFLHESSVASRFEELKACSVKWMVLPTPYQRTERKATGSSYSDAVQQPSFGQALAIPQLQEADCGVYLPRENYKPSSESLV